MAGWLQWWWLRKKMMSRGRKVGVEASLVCLSQTRRLPVSLFLAPRRRCKQLQRCPSNLQVPNKARRAFHAIMGIRHLTTSLRPYATLESLSGRTVVIDGPSFAHQIYYICLRAAPRAKNAFEAAPSYRELGEVAIAWLDGLRGSNVEM